MAGQSDLLTGLRQSAAAFDDDALVALANRGLLRRAAKDVENSPPETTPASEDDSFTILVADQRVSLAESLADSTCDCPASGVCRHILAAILWLRQDADDSEPAPEFQEDEILGLDDEQIRKWAGSPLLRCAFDRVSKGLDATFLEQGGQLVIELPILNQTTRWLTGKGPEGMLCSCHEKAACLHKVVTVLKYQVEKGHRELVIGDKMLEAAAGAPRTRAEVIASARSAIRDILTSGFSRLSVESSNRLQTLSVSAHGVDLPRLERALSAAAEEASLHARKRVEANPSVLLGRLATIEMLCHALKNPAPGVIGQHRGDYVNLGKLKLIGVGANAWTTRSGYRGVTAYFFEPRNRKWFSWTDTRPADQEDFDPVNRFSADGPWQGIGSPEEAVRSELQLTNVYATAEGRLSGRSATKALRLGDANLESCAPIETCAALREMAAGLFGNGLSAPAANEFCVLFRPAEWSDGILDQAEQRVTRTIRDGDGDDITLVRTLGGAGFENAAALEFQKLDPPPGSVVFGKLTLDRGDVAIFPLSILSPKTRWHAGLSGDGTTKRRKKAESAPDLAAIIAGIDSTAPALEKLIERLNELCLSLAESGVRVFSSRQQSDLAEYRRALEDAGLDHLERIAVRIESLERHNRHGMARKDLSTTLLFFKHVLDLHGSQLVLGKISRPG